MVADGGWFARLHVVGLDLRMQHSNLFADVRYPEGHVFEDIATTYRLVMRAGRVVYMPHALCHYRERSGSISRQHSAQNLVDYWRAYLLRYEELRGLGGEYRASRVQLAVRMASVVKLAWVRLGVWSDEWLV